jgi:hypothetical protein
MITLTTVKHYLFYILRYASWQFQETLILLQETPIFLGLEEKPDEIKCEEIP